MTILGMGTVEILVVLLVGFIVLGPGRMVDAARLLGKATREVRRLTEGLPELVMDQDLGDTGEKPIVHRRGGRPVDPDDQAEAKVSGETDSEEDGPVAFRQSRSPSGGEESGKDQGREDS